MNPGFTHRLRAGEKLVGTLATLPCPEIAEGLAEAGFDWLWIDLEHAPLSLRETQQILSAIAGRAHGLVRVPANDATWIQQTLDLGAEGIIVPQVQSASEAARAVAAAKYPPLGTRSAGLGRAQGHGLNFQSYVAQANERVAVLLQVEHIRAVRSLGEILAVPGVDAVIVGPYDLSGSLGVLGQTAHPTVQAAIAEVKAACHQRSMPIGTFTFQPEEAKAFLAAGYDFVALGLDAHYLLHAARQAVGTVKGMKE